MIIPNATVPLNLSFQFSDSVLLSQIEEVGHLETITNQAYLISEELNDFTNTAFSLITNKVQGA